MKISFKNENETNMLTDIQKFKEFIASRLQSEKCEEYSSHRRSMTPDGNMDLYKGKKSTGIGNYININILNLLTMWISLLLNKMVIIYCLKHMTITLGPGREKQKCIIVRSL